MMPSKSYFGAKKVNIARIQIRILKLQILCNALNGNFFVRLECHSTNIKNANYS